MRAIRLPVVCAALAGLLLAAVASAAVPEPGWLLRFNGYWLDAKEGRVSPDNTAYRSQVENSEAVAGSVAGEYRFGPRLGVELGLLAGADNDYTVTFDGGMVAATDTMAFEALCIGLNFHLTPGKKADFYAGPLVAYMSYSHMSREFPALPGSPGIAVSVNIDDEVALGANLGVDVPIGKGHWLFNAALKYLTASPDTTLSGFPAIQPRRSAAIDPLLAGVGFGYRF